MDRDAVRAQQADALMRLRGEDMKSMHGMLCTAGVAAMLAAATALAAEGGSDAEAGWAAVTRCAQQDTERARHDCVDQVLRDAGVLTPELRARQQQRAFGLDRATSPVPAAPPPAAVQPVAPPPVATAPTAPAPTRSAAKASPESSPDRVEVEVASAVAGRDGKLVVTTTDGAVWRQTESITNYRLPAAGERMTIRKGSLGGYLCTPSSKLSWRCARDR
jgi:hypothetical protein